MTIQRYTGENVEFHTTGDLVAYEDYAELKEEYERLDKSHSAALAKIDSLAAENAALKAYIDDKCLIMNPAGLGDVMDADSSNVGTPAPDAYAASLRAEGVEMALTGLLSYLNHGVDIDSMETKWDVSSAVVEYINSQLRSKPEVQS